MSAKSDQTGRGKSVNLLIISVLLFSMICPSCSDSECSNDVIEEISSPDGKMKIVLFSRNCGATTGFNTQAMILAFDERMPDEVGNTFIVDKGTAKATWTKEGGVSVVFDADVRVFKQETSVRGIPINYPSQSD